MLQLFHHLGRELIGAEPPARHLIQAVGDELLRPGLLPEPAAGGPLDYVTSALEQPAIGRVSAVQRSGGAYREIAVQPAVNFGNLEDVLVVLSPTDAAAAAAAEATK